MISLDQILILEQKVESAVKKISQLQAENDALRSKCAELTNALSSKSEQLSSFEQDQGLIESKIASLISRFANIENSVMDAISQTTSAPVQEQIQVSRQEAAPAPQAPQQPVYTPAPAEQHTETPAFTPVQAETSSQPHFFETTPQETAPEQQDSQSFTEQPENNTAQPGFFDMNELGSESKDSQNGDTTQFDIF